MGGAFRLLHPYGGLYLPGEGGHYASTPDTAGLGVTGDLDIAVKAALTNWASGATQTLTSKWTSAESSWILRLKATGELQLQITSDGTAGTQQFYQSAVPAFANEQAKWVRCALDVDNGAGNSVARFYESADGESWTQIGPDATGSVTTVYSGAAPLQVGARNEGGAETHEGVYYEVVMKDGIAGTVVANPVFQHPTTNWTLNGTTMHDGYGLWTLNGDRWEWR